MKASQFTLLLAVAGSGAASCTVGGDPPTPDVALSPLLATFPPPGFTKLNSRPFPTEAGYSSDTVNIWANDTALDLYSSLPGAIGLIEPGWVGTDGPAPANSFAKGSVLIRQDTATGVFAIMARPSGTTPTGASSWSWLKKDDTGLHDAQGCWTCHGEFSSTDGAIGVAASQR
jgi:hypothetical protein